MSTRLIPAYQSFLDGNGDPLSGGKLYFYETGTTTPKDTYSDVDNTTPNTNPIILNSAGRLDNDVWGDGEIKMVIKDSADVTVKTYDPLVRFAFYGVPYASELSDEQLGLVFGAIRQEQPANVSITRSGTTATVTKVAHGYSNGQYVVHQGADQDEYNIYTAISNVTTDTYDYTVSGSPATPATGTPKSYRPAKWDYIINSTHGAIGVDTGTLTASAYDLVITFSQAYTKTGSLVVVPDETLAKKFGGALGASVGTSVAAINLGASLNGTAKIYYDSGWTVEQGSGGTNDMNVAVTNSGANITITHDYMPGDAVSLTGYTKGGTVVPKIPVIKSIADTNMVANFLDYSGATDTTEDTTWSMVLNKSYSGQIPLDGSDGSYTLNLYEGNIWFMGVMRV